MAAASDHPLDPLLCPFCLPVEESFLGADAFIEHVLSSHGMSEPRNASDAMRRVNHRRLIRRDSGVDLSMDETFASEEEGQEQQRNDRLADMAPRLARVKALAARYFSNHARRCQLLYRQSRAASSVLPATSPPVPAPAASVDHPASRSSSSSYPSALPAPSLPVPAAAPTVEHPATPSPSPYISPVSPTVQHVVAPSSGVPAPPPFVEHSDAPSSRISAVQHAEHASAPALPDLRGPGLAGHDARHSPTPVTASRRLTVDEEILDIEAKRVRLRCLIEHSVSNRRVPYNYADYREVRLAIIRRRSEQMSSHLSPRRPTPLSRRINNSPPAASTQP